jgi:hypothetical protein
MYDPNMKPDRSSVILVLALCSFMVMMLGCFTCLPFAIFALALSIPAIVMGRRDLQSIERGEMVPTGRETINISIIFAAVSAALSALAGLIGIAVALLYGGMIVAFLGAALASGA